MILKASSAVAFLSAHPSATVAASAIAAPSTSTLPGRLSHTHHGLNRRYATSRDPPTNDPLSSGSGGDIPPRWPTTTHPTPYDIFAIPLKSPYTKKRFYQLVKLYHPDIYHTHTHAHTRSHVADPGMSPAVRLERYRLIVAANDLLSDPNRRHLYDAHGIGWPPDGPLSRNAELRAADRSWRHQPGSAANNATWEDWERWHEARDPGRGDKQQQHQGPMYMPNSVFATLVAMLCAVGALAQGRMAETAGAHFVDVTGQKHQEVSDGVRRSTMASSGMSKDERVERFLRDRENVSFQFEPGRYEEAPGNTKSG